jgi:hypothetical protein
MGYKKGKARHQKSVWLNWFYWFAAAAKKMV